MNVPNLLSLVRLPLAVAFLLLTGTVERSLIIVAAGVSDYLDGWWARTKGPATRTGAVLDPITDKIFVVTALLTFVFEDALPLAGLLILLARDVFVTAGALLIAAARMPVRLQARFPGKLLTTIQIAAVLVLTILPQFITWVVLAAALVTVWAIVDYALATVSALRAQAERR